MTRLSLQLSKRLFPMRKRRSLERVSGRFYTPDVIAVELTQRLAQMLVARAKASMLGSSVRVCDPFCGDGRLIAALLSQVAMHKILSSRRWIVTLQDIERAAVAGAHTLVTATASDLGLDFEVRCVVADSFGIAIPYSHRRRRHKSPVGIVEAGTIASWGT